MISLIGSLVLLVLGWATGHWAEQRHFRSIKQRQRRYRAIVLSSQRLFDAPDKVAQSQLVWGSTVVSVDYFKRFLAAIRLLVGGSLRSYESLMERARQEAVLRMTEQAHQLGATHIINIKLQTSSISLGGYQQLGSVEVMAYGTALITQDNTAAHAQTLNWQQLQAQQSQGRHLPA